MKPRQDDIDGQIGHTRDAEQRARIGLAPTPEGPVPFPKCIRFHNQQVRQRRSKFGFGVIHPQLLLQSGKQIIEGEPMGQKNKATHGMVGGAQAGKAPELGGDFAAPVHHARATNDPKGR